MSVPPLLGLRNVKVPVTNLAVALDWYGKVLGFRPTIEFPDSEGVVRGVHGDLPGIRRAAPSLHAVPKTGAGLSGPPRFRCSLATDYQ